MNPWTRDVLGDLACALYSCGLEAIPCKEGDYNAKPPDIGLTIGCTKRSSQNTQCLPLIM